MNRDLDLQKTSEYILSQDATRDYSDEEIIELETTVNKLIAKYTWPVVLDEWIKYLHTKCKTEAEVVTFAQNFFDYARDRYIPDPIHFVAYLHYRVNTLENDDAMQIFDSLAISVLENAGLLDMMQTPLYTAEMDPRIQAEIAVIKSLETD